MDADPPKPARKKKAPSDGSVQRCFDAWARLFEAKWHMKATHISPGKDGRHFKDLVRAFGDERTLELMARFFATTNPQIARSDYSVGAFFRLAQTLVLDDMKIDDARTLSNIDAVARATGRRR